MKVNGSMTVNEASLSSFYHEAASSLLIGRSRCWSSIQDGVFPGGACCRRCRSVFKESPSPGETLFMFGNRNRVFDKRTVGQSACFPEGQWISLREAASQARSCARRLLDLLINFKYWFYQELQIKILHPSLSLHSCQLLQQSAEPLNNFYSTLLYRNCRMS